MPSTSTKMIELKHGHLLTNMEARKHSKKIGLGRRHRDNHYGLENTRSKLTTKTFGPSERNVASVNVCHIRSAFTPRKPKILCLPNRSVTVGYWFSTRRQYIIRGQDGGNEGPSLPVRKDFSGTDSEIASSHGKH